MRALFARLILRMSRLPDWAFIMTAVIAGVVSTVAALFLVEWIW